MVKIRKLIKNLILFCKPLPNKDGYDYIFGVEINKCPHCGKRINKYPNGGGPF